MKYDLNSKFPFGKNQGKLMKDIPKEYFIWVRKNIKKLESGLKVFIDEEILKKKQNEKNRCKIFI